MANQKEEVEEAEILAYSESDQQLPSNQEQLEYYLKRLVIVRDGYTYLKVQQDEVKAYKDAVHRDMMLAKLQKLFRENYIERVAIVTELRKLGKKVDDPFVPLSKI